MAISSPLVVQKAKELYFKYRGTNHRAIEREMYALGCLTFNRRNLYNQTTRDGRTRLGWIKRFKWDEELVQSASFSSSDNIAGQPGRRSCGAETSHRTVDIRMNAAPAFTNSSTAQADTRAADDPFRHVSCDFVVKHKAATTNQHELHERSPNKDLPTFNPKPETSFPEWLKQLRGNYRWDWPYQRLIYEKLQQITDGTSKRLMIFLPPRHGKSELVTVRYSAWRLKQDPTTNIILGSYNQRLANRFSRKVRITWDDSLQADKTATQTAETRR
jgi:hypothetical protein